MWLERTDCVSRIFESLRNSSEGKEIIFSQQDLERNFSTGKIAMCFGPEIRHYRIPIERRGDVADVSYLLVKVE